MAKITLREEDGITDELLAALERVRTVVAPELTLEQYVVRGVKDKLIAMGITWWMTAFELNEANVK